MKKIVRILSGKNILFLMCFIFLSYVSDIIKKKHLKLKRTTFIGFFFLIFTLIMSLNVNAQWARTYGGIYEDWARTIQNTDDGGYVVAGKNTGDFWICKLYSNGSIEWERKYINPRAGTIYSIKQTSDSGYIVAGIYDTGVWGAYWWDWVILKIKSNGDIEWSFYYGTNPKDWAYSISPTIDGGYIAAGEGSGDIWVLKLSYNGSIEWQRRYDGGGSERANSIYQTSDGGYIVAGVIKHTDYEDFLVLKLSPIGDIEWQYIYGKGHHGQSNVIEKTIEGGYIVAGGDYDDLWVLKLSYNGSIEWQRRYDGSESERAYSIHQTDDKGYIVVGVVKEGYYEDFLVLKLSPIGDIEWQRRYGGSNTDRAYDIHQTKDGGYIVGGVTFSYGEGNGDFLILKLSKDGDIDKSCDNFNKSYDIVIYERNYVSKIANLISYDLDTMPYDTNIYYINNNNVTENIICQAIPNCIDGIKNGDETDIDCGGTCPPCKYGKHCLINSDCESNYCENNICKIIGCADNDNDNHQDMKCGGDDCIDSNASTTRCPVLLVHGYWVIDPNGTWYTIKERLKNDSFNIYEIDLEPWIIPANGDITNYAKKLDDEISQIQTITNAAKIDLVTHNMGGLVSRWYTRFGYKNNVRKLIMLGTPNHGSELFYGKHALSILSKFIIKLKLIDTVADFAVGKAGKQMTPHSFFLNMLNYGNPLKFKGTDILTPDITHATIGGTKGFFLTSFFLAGEDDGFVRIKSLKLDNIDYPYHTKYNVSHPGLHESFDVYLKVKDILLENETEITEPEILEENVSQIQEASYETEEIESDYDTYNVSISYTDKALFLLSWFNESAELNLNLTLPNGTEINYLTDSITYYPNNRTINETTESYIVEYPQQGLWKAKVILENGIKTDYTFTVILDTDLKILILPNQSNYRLNESIGLNVNLTNFNNPITNAFVKAEIKNPNNNIEEILLYDDGTNGDAQANDGSYFNVYNNTNTLGIYEINVIANGTLDSTNFYRQSTIETEVYEPIDLYINNSEIYFSKDNPFAGEIINITATIHSNSNIDLENVTIKFYDEDPRNYGTLINEKVVNINSNSKINVTTDWSTTYGNKSIYVLIYPFNSFIEENYDNNLAYNSIMVFAKSIINLSQGWNLISIPIVLENKTISYTLSSIEGNYGNMFTYLDNKLLQLNNNSEINETIGFWIKMLAEDNLTINGTLPVNPVFNLEQGYTLIGYPSLNESNVSYIFKNVSDDLINVLGYENNGWKSYSPLKNKSLNTLKIIKPGHGYWVNLNNNMTWSFNENFKHQH